MDYYDNENIEYSTLSSAAGDCMHINSFILIDNSILYTIIYYVNNNIVLVYLLVLS
jgi:hypothetical protein